MTKRVLSLASLGHALLTVAAGVALQPREKQSVVDTAQDFIDLAHTLDERLKGLKDAPRPTKAELKAALAELLPDALAGIVEAQVRKIVEEKANA